MESIRWGILTRRLYSIYVSEEGFKVDDGKGGEEVYHHLEMIPVSLGKSQ